MKNHPLYCLGKSKPRRDKRTLRLATLFKTLPPLPDQYDFDLAHRNVPVPMYSNDVLSDCVLAGRAHQTLRFELSEQGAPPRIADRDVTREYFKETGGADDGLVMLDSLNAWRKSGWKAAGHTYHIHAFGSIDPQGPGEVRAAIYLLTGCQFGLSLPISAQAQVQSGQPWSVVQGASGRPGSWGGHCVLCVGYAPVGPVCVTWGQKQQMTWEFVSKYCDEAYGVVDARDRFMGKRSPLDLKALDAYLAQIAG